MTNYFVWIKIALQALVVGLIFAGGYGVGVSKGERHIVQLEKEHAQDRKSWNDAQVLAERRFADAQREEQAKQNEDIDAVERVAEAERKRAAALATRIAGLERNARLVRDHFARVATQANLAGKDASTTSGSPTGTSAGLVLADVFRSADEEALELGHALDRCHARGRTCEAAYDAVRNTNPQAGETANGS